MLQTLTKGIRLFSTSAIKMSPSITKDAVKPRHLVSMLELSNDELTSLVAKAGHYKSLIKSGEPIADSITSALKTKVVALVFNKRSTRTRISSEGASVFFGAHPMFLGKDDIQLGVNESLYDTTKVISSMTSCIFARVGPHSDIQQLCEHSSVPIINSLCDTFHPLQAIADLLTIKEYFGYTKGLNLTWIGDANNVINDLTIAALRFGINVNVVTPSSIDFDGKIAKAAVEVAESTGATVTFSHDPIEALKDSNIIVTDTWISMGQEAEKAAKLEQFAGFQITSEMLSKGKVSENHIFMHCLPRHNEEVDDSVFYSDKSVVFEEAENRLYAAMAAIDGFVINKGDLLK